MSILVIVANSDKDKNELRKLQESYNALITSGDSDPITTLNCAICKSLTVELLKELLEEIDSDPKYPDDIKKLYTEMIEGEIALKSLVG
jgi:hypothetical protein